MDKLGLKAEFQGTSGIVSDAFIQGLGPLAEGVVAFREGAPDREAAGRQVLHRAVRQGGLQRAGRGLRPFAFAGMNLLLDTIEAVGPDREAVTKALANVKDRRSIIGPITFDGHGQNTVALIAEYVVQDGKWLVWEDSVTPAASAS